jgi:hypothetical protein
MVVEQSSPEFVAVLEMTPPGHSDSLLDDWGLE